MARSPALTFSVVILNWNGRAYLEACLDALRAQTRPAERVILADNGSSDGSPAFVRRRYPWVEVRENGGNIGFAAGNNAALRDVSTDAALLLNPDVVLSPDCLAALAEAMAGDPAIGIAGGKLWYPDGVTIQHGGGRITHPRAMPGHFGMGEADAGQCDQPRDVDYVIGAALAVRRDVLGQIGLLDEGFFLFFEDADLCTRAARAGYRVAYLPAATGIHIESATAVRGSFSYLYRFHSGRWRYLLKHFAVEEIAGATPTEEAAWLRRAPADERRAAGLAYLATRRQLPEIWAAREREGAGTVSPEARQAVDDSLATLQAAARPDALHAGTLDRLSLAAALWAPAPPVDGFGPRALAARLRALWNNIATRWHMRHYVARQTEFNRLAVEQIRRYEAEANEMMALLEEQAVIHSELQRRVQELQARISELQVSIK